ncbi:MAG: GPI inositol-deacylase [Fibrobacterales bacterium]
MKKILKTIIYGQMLLGSAVFADHWCSSGHSDYNKLSKSSGCVKNPIVFVHGITSDMRDIGGGTVDPNDVGYVRNSGNVGKVIAQSVADLYNAQYDTFDEINNNGMEFFTTPHKDDLIPDQAAALHQRLKEILAEYYPDWETNAERKVDLIAHSQGGIVSRYLVKNFTDVTLKNPVNHINHIVTLNTPHLGSEWAGVEGGDLSKTHYFINTISEAVLSSANQVGWVNSFMNIFGAGFLDEDGESAITRIISESDQWRVGGSFMTALGGHPVRPRDGKEIAFTTFGSVHAGVGRDLLLDLEGMDYAAYPWDKCLVGGREDLDDPDKCLFAELAFAIDAYDYPGDAYGDLNAVEKKYNTDGAWATQSDMVSSLNSQHGVGLFTEASNAYRRIKIEGAEFATLNYGSKSYSRIPHGNSSAWSNLLGPNYAGNYVADYIGYGDIPSTWDEPSYVKSLDISSLTRIDINDLHCRSIYETTAVEGEAVKCMLQGIDVPLLSIDVAGVSKVSLKWKVQGYTGPHIKVLIDGIETERTYSTVYEGVEIELFGNTTVEIVGTALSGADYYLDDLKMEYNIVPTIIVPLLLN